MTPAVPSPIEKKRGTYRRHFIRDKKNSPVFDLQDRDVSIIQAVFENRFLTAPLLAQLFPPDETARARKGITAAAPFAPYNNLRVRLRNLFHDGFLFRFRTVIGGELIYSIDSKGVQLLKKRQIPLPLPEDDWRPDKETPATLFVDHTLMVARFRAALQRALHEHQRYTLQSFQREALDLKAEWRRGNTRVYVNPDAFFILKDTQTASYLAYFLEADRSTMQLSRLLEKYKNYSALYEDRKHIEAFGIPRFNVLTVCKSTERAANILTLTASEQSPVPAHHKLFFYFTTAEAYHNAPTNILAAIWRRADETDQQRAIVVSPLARS